MVNPITLFLRSHPLRPLKQLFTDKENVEPVGEVQKQERKVIICAFCSNPVTDPAQIISVNGAHHHTFVNPHGIFFDTGCFRDCDGCVVEQAASPEFSWFHGYSWQIAGCNRCRQHLGWLFSSDNIRHYSSEKPCYLKQSCQYSSFYCLILDNLIIP